MGQRTSPARPAHSRATISPLSLKASTNSPLSAGRSCGRVLKRPSLSWPSRPLPARLVRLQQLALATAAEDLAVPEDDGAAQDGGRDRAAELTADIWTQRPAAMEHACLQGPLARQVNQGEVGVRAWGHGTLARVQPKQPGRVGGRQSDQVSQRQAALVNALAEDARQQRLDAGDATPSAPNIVAALLLLLRQAGRMVGGDALHVASQHLPPQPLDGLSSAQWWGTLGHGPIDR